MIHNVAAETINFESILAGADVALAKIGLDGSCLLPNRRFCQMLGYPEEELRTKHLQDLFHGETYQDILAGTNILLDGRASWHSIEKRYIRKDKSESWGRLHRFLVKDQRSRPGYFIAVLEDFTERVEAEKALWESESRLGMVLESAGLALWDCDLRTGKTVISREYARLHGLPENHRPLTHDDWLKLIHPDDRQRVQEQYRESLERTHTWDTEFRLQWPDGSVHWILAKGRAFVDSKGCPIRLAGVSLEITDRKRLEEQRQLLASIVDSSEDAIFSKSMEGTIVSWNAGAEKIFGYSAEEIIGKPVSVLLPPERVNEFPDIVQRIRAGTRLEQYGVTRVRKDGSRIEVFVGISPIKDCAGVVVGSSTIAREVTAQRRAEAALQQSEERFRLAIKATNDAIWDIDLETGIVTWNETYSKLYGRPTQTSDSWQWWIDHIHPDDRERTASTLRHAIASNQASWTCEYRLLQVDGAWAHVFDRAYIARDPSGKAWRVIGAIQDLTVRRRADAALRESEERFRNLANTAPVMIWVSGPDKLCTFFNTAWLAFTGRSMEAECGNGWAAGVHPADLDRCVDHYSSSFDAREEFQMEYRLRRADGQYRWVLDNGVPRFERGGTFAGYVGSCIDITDLKRAQEEAIARQKLESLGVLANGIAHDFNNLLGAILASTELAAAESAEGQSPAEELEQIRTASIRGAEIVRELMVFGGSDGTAFEPVDLSGLIRELLALLRVSLSKQAVLETELAPRLPLVHANAAQIRQAIMNLVINASDAIGQRGGTIHITTEQASPADVAAIDQSSSSARSEFVRLEVSDTGDGMTPEVQARIFDPFFTTKEAGRGLGMSVVQGIIRSHGGFLSITSTPGQGSSFEILLPCAEASDAEEREFLVPHTFAGTEHPIGTVLMIEDEDLLRITVSKILRKQGFTVLEVATATAAADLFREKYAAIDVILLDVTLPGMSCRDLLTVLRETRDDVKVILTTAFTADKALLEAGGWRPWGFLRKPYIWSDLTGLLHSACADRVGSTRAAGTS